MPAWRCSATGFCGYYHASLMLKLLLAVLTALTSGVGSVPHPMPPPAIPTAAAERVFARAHALCEADGGRLWGVSLCVPLMLVDPATRQAVANAALPGSKRDGDVFRLTLPEGTQISTAPTSYRGVSLAELIWPLFGSDETQAVSLMHESFHVVQPKLGFSGYAEDSSIAGDSFLDTQTGRIWLRGEFAALTVALATNGEARRAALRDALAMRAYRDAILPGTAEPERQQDIIEGLAEATGIDAGLLPQRRIDYALHDIAFVEAQPSYARAFAYATGPAYSELLDAVQPRWRRTVTQASDITQMAMRTYGLSVATPLAAQARAVLYRYGGAAIEAQEAELAKHKAELLAKYARELIAGPTLWLPLAHMKITFNPRDIETFAPYGSVYHTLTVTAKWGTIAVSGGDAMISKAFDVLTVPAPRDIRGRAVRGDGWILHLATGSGIVPDPRKPGSYTVR